MTQIQELSEEYGIRRVEALDTVVHWKRQAGGSAEYRRQLKIITEETREQLQILVGYRIPKIEEGKGIPSLARAFAEALEGCRAPSRSRSRSRSRWQHPGVHKYALEEA